MIAGIVGVPKRAEIIGDLVSIIQPSVDRVEVFWDHDYQGQRWNAIRCYREMCASARPDEPVLLMTDDVTTVPDWRERWEKIHSEAKDEIYTLFNRKRHLFKEENLARGWVKGHHKKCFYDQAFIVINKPNFADDILNWQKNWTAPSEFMRKKSERWFDFSIEYYLEDKKIPHTITTPTLFDHLPVKSTLGHDGDGAVGGSPYYVGHTNQE